MNAIFEGARLAGFWLVVLIVVLVLGCLGLALNDYDDLRAERATQLDKQDATYQARLAANTKESK